MRVTSLIAIFAATQFAGAHDLYILPARFVTPAGASLIAGIHNGDSFPKSEVGPVLERVRDAHLISSTGVSALLDLTIAGKRGIAMFTAPRAGEYLLALRTVPNFIALEPAQFLAYLKEEGLQHVIDWRESHGESSTPSRERYSKPAKALLVTGASDGFFSREAGHALEIVPEHDPYTAHSGDMLPVRIVFQGKPAEGIQVEAAWAARGQSKTSIAGRTGDDGRVMVRLDKTGFWRIHAVKMERCANPSAADWESYWASFTFELR